MNYKQQTGLFMWVIEPHSLTVSSIKATCPRGYKTCFMLSTEHENYDYPED